MLEDFRDFITWWCCDEWAWQHRQELAASPLSTVYVSTAEGQSLTHSRGPGLVWEISCSHRETP